MFNLNQLKSWQVLTDIKKEKWGHLVIYHSCEQKLQEELYATCDEDELTKTTGLDVVLKELDKKYKVQVQDTRTTSLNNIYTLMN